MKLYIAMMLMVVPGIGFAGTIPVSINPDDCQELVESADNYAKAVRLAGNEAAQSIDSGSDDLSESSCLNKFDGFSFNSFDGLPTMRGAVIQAAKEMAKKTLKDLAAEGCAFANSAMKAAKTATTCNASVGVNINADVGTNIDAVDADACMGADGGGIDYKLDESFGNGQGGYGLDTSAIGNQSEELNFWD